MKLFIIYFLGLAFSSTSAKNCAERIFLSDPENRNISGTVAAVGQFPYQVGLLFSNDDVNWNCGGALISSKWVLTAAQCVYGAFFVQVILGAAEWENPELSFNVDGNNFIQHEDYLADGFYNDIALVKIPEVNFTKNIQKIDLPKKTSSKLLNSIPYVGGMVINSAWGLIDDNTTDPHALKYTESQVLETAKCAAIYGIQKGLSTAEICTLSAFGNSTCSGDSGGPLASVDLKTLLGIATFRSVCCNDGKPQIYTNVASQLNWIKAQTGIED